MEMELHTPAYSPVSSRPLTRPQSTNWTPPDAEVLISFRFEPTAPIGLAAWRTHSPPLPVHSPPLMQGHDVETLGNRASQLASAVSPGTRCPFSVFRTVLRNGLYLQSGTDACLAPTVIRMPSGIFLPPPLSPMQGLAESVTFWAALKPQSDSTEI